MAEAVEATAPIGLPLLAPVATWAGGDAQRRAGARDPARHRGTLLRMVARDTEVAARLAEDVRAAEQQAFVVAGDHEYGMQLDGQLDHVGLPRVATRRPPTSSCSAGWRAGPRWRARRGSVCR